MTTHNRTATRDMARTAKPPNAIMCHRFVAPLLSGISFEKRYCRAALQDAVALSYAHPTFRQVLECGSPLPLSHRHTTTVLRSREPLPLRSGLEVVRELQTVSLESINRSYARRGHRAFKPTRRTPRILVCREHEPVF